MKMFGILKKVNKSRKEHKTISLKKTEEKTKTK
jgi:hypothetical protein